MRLSSLNQIIGSVLAMLPASAKAKLEQHWKTQPGVHPETNEEMEAPVFIIANRWSEITYEEGWCFGEFFHNDHCPVFDEDFLMDSPPEAIKSHLALVFAQIYLNATRDVASAPSPHVTESAKELLKQWGLATYDLFIWVTAQNNYPANPTAMFYAVRFYLNKQLPPACADINTICEIVRRKGNYAMAKTLWAEFHKTHFPIISLPDGGNPMWN